MWFRWYCLRTSLSASKAPRLSNLFNAITSAKSSISIFSNCVAAPNSGVITYKLTSECSIISVSDCPIPDVSKIIRSKLANCSTAIASATCLDKERFDCLVAKERIYTLSFETEFMRILSPSNAPPVFLLEGSTETTAIRLSSKSERKRRTNSSTKDDFPAPPRSEEHTSKLQSRPNLECRIPLVTKNKNTTARQHPDA